ncbi:MAG: PEP-CTERM sorting domain-containing protein [Betaproteobacteria bacterium]|nr:MAG: PEP-CTERM sorting domain-containing protein [Betaproteobacteria bacterium]
MIMKSTLSWIGLALGLATAPVIANPIPTITPDSPLLIQITNVEQFCATNCITSGGSPEGNWGVFNISTINLSSVQTPNRFIAGSSGAIFTDIAGHGNGQLSGIFYGIQVTGATTATSGFLDLYWDSTAAGTPATVADTGTALPTSRCGQACFTGFTDGIQLLHLAFNWGVDDNNLTVFISSDIDPSTLTTGVEGHANGFLDVILSGLPWDSIFNTNYFHVGGAFSTGPCVGDGAGPCPAEERDFRFRNTFTTQTNWNGAPGSGILGFGSTDPVTTFSAPVTVPEPSALALLAIGLLGCAWARRRA